MLPRQAGHAGSRKTELNLFDDSLFSFMRRNALTGRGRASIQKRTFLIRSEIDLLYSVTSPPTPRHLEPVIPNPAFTEI